MTNFGASRGQLWLRGDGVTVCRDLQTFESPGLNEEGKASPAPPSQNAIQTLGRSGWRRQRRRRRVWLLSLNRARERGRAPDEKDAKFLVPHDGQGRPTPDSL